MEAEQGGQTSVLNAVGYERTEAHLACRVASRRRLWRLSPSWQRSPRVDWWPSSHGRKMRACLSPEPLPRARRCSSITPDRHRLALDDPKLLSARGRSARSSSSSAHERWNWPDQMSVSRRSGGWLLELGKFAAAG